MISPFSRSPMHKNSAVSPVGAITSKKSNNNTPARDPSKTTTPIKTLVRTPTPNKASVRNTTPAKQNST